MNREVLVILNLAPRDQVEGPLFAGNSKSLRRGSHYRERKFSFRGQQYMLAVFDAEASGMASGSVSDGGMLLSCSFIAFPTNGLCS